MRRSLFAILLVLLPVTAVAQTQVPSVRDIIELSRGGLADDVILALIEVNGSVYSTDPATLKALKDAGVSSAVIVAMVRSGRDRQPPVEAASAADPGSVPVQPGPQVVVVERDAPERERVREVVVPVPVYVGVPTRRVHDGRYPRGGKPVEPVYWGWGGKLRPDAWKPATAADVQPDAKIPPAQKK